VEWLGRGIVCYCAKDFRHQDSRTQRFTKKVFAMHKEILCEPLCSL